MSNQSEPLVPLISHWNAFRRPSASRVASIVPMVPLSNSTTASTASSTLRPGTNVFTSAESADDLTDEETAEIDDVSRQIANRSRARFLGAEPPGVEARILGPVLEVARSEVANLSDLAAFDELAGEPDRGHEPVVEAAKMLDPRRRHSRPDLVRLVRVAAERLLAEDMLAGLGSRDRRLGMNGVWPAVVEQADCRVGDEVAPVGRPALISEPLGGGRDRGLVPAGEGDEPRHEWRRPGDMADVQKGARVRLAHERVAEHPDSDLGDRARRRHLWRSPMPVCRDSPMAFARYYVGR